ncbi:peptidase inhibitor family I36 protein [Promicromonospora sp. NPDC050880]|uniref:peptidase inhibitor family I36 protein n=1 Tax=Promicromonospora sp. NPDC050880 TaxID=3364406 RepID=UPI003796DF38
MSRTMRRLAALVATAAAVAAAVVVPGTAAQAATRDGICDAGEFCYYYNSDHAGSISDFDVSVGDYGTEQPSCYDFKGAGAGQGLCLKNDAASVWNRSAKPVRVYYNSEYGGTYQEVAAGAKVNLNSTLKNNNASHRFGPFVTAPPSHASYYVSVQDTSWAYDTGCTMGTRDASRAGTQTTVVVLAFGKTTLGSDGVHVLSYFGGADRQFSAARQMVVAMGKGYDDCTGSDTASRLRIGLGTNNTPGSALTGAAGAALATAAKNAAADLAGYPQATAWGANDFEAWGSTSGLNSQSRAWLNGYNGVSGRPPLVNFGSADGCPTTSVPSAGSCNPGLTADTIWYVSTSGAAQPLPEIYTTSGSQAKQWKFLSLYAYGKGAKLTFPGVMSQRGACDQRGCEGTDNSPTASWLQLDEQVDSDSRTATTPGAPTSIYWQEDLVAAAGQDETGAVASAAARTAAWPAGIFDDAEAPVRGAELLGSNRWVGHAGGRTLMVWAGRSGEDRTLGRVLVATTGTGLMTASHRTVDLPGTGALRVVTAHGAVLELVDEHGTRHVLDAASATVR